MSGADTHMNWSGPTAARLRRLSAPLREQLLRHPALALFSAALLVRLLLIAGLGGGAAPAAWGDDWDYDRIATTLLAEGTYANTWFPPGYPLFLAVIYAAVGHSVAAVRIVQALLGAWSCVLTARLGRECFSPRVGWLAGALLAVYPGHAYLSWRLMAEAPYIVLLLLALLAAQRAARRRDLASAIAVGLALGVATLFKSNLFLLPPLLLLWLYVVTRQAAGARVAATAAAVFVALTAATPIANLLARDGGAAALPGNAGHTLWWSNNPLADGYFIAAEERPEGQAFLAAHGYADALAGADRLERDRILRRAALDWMWSQRGELPALLAKKLNNAFGLFPRAASFGESRWAGVVHLLTYGALLPFIVVGLLRNVPRLRQLALLYMVPVSYVAMVLLFYGTPRYTILVLPCLLPFAADALWRGVALVQQRGQARRAALSPLAGVR